MSGAFQWVGGALCLVACLLATGCESTLLNQKADIKNIFGPAGRKAKNAVEIVQRDPLAPLEGSEEFDAAKKLYDEKKYTEARKEFAAVAKKYKNKPIEEDAMFMVAESYFHMQYYAKAQDAYDELFKKYPSTRYLEEGTKRLFQIARVWLNSPKPASQVELAAFTKEGPEANLEKIPDAKVPFAFPLTPNLFDNSRPLFDTQGNALKALRSVWMNDPTGPLADDALMLAATHHLRKGDYREADHYYSTIREQYANGEHAPAAYVLGSHASHKSYQGSKYDGKQLEEAQKLTDSAMRLFPELPQREKMQGDLTKMRQQAADRDWERVQFHTKRGEKDSAAVYAEYILEQFPHSTHAEAAKKVLLDLGPEYQQGILKTPIHKPQATPVDPNEPLPESDDESEEPEEPGRVRFSDDDMRPIDESE